MTIIYQPHLYGGGSGSGWTTQNLKGWRDQLSWRWFALIITVCTIIVGGLFACVGIDPAHNYTWQRRGQLVGDSVKSFCTSGPAQDEARTFWDAIDQRAGGARVMVTCPPRQGKNHPNP